MALEPFKSVISMVEAVQVDRSEWPLPAYIEAWKAFRSVSNEAEEIAKHLIRQKWNPQKTPINILDVGTGDGVLLEKILLFCNTAVRDVYAIDPNPAFLAEARSHLAHVGIGGKLHLIKDRIENVHRDIISDSDVAIFSHVVYLAGAEALMGTLRNLRPGSCCYAVFDAEDSIFSRLWQRTAAPEYLVRVQDARRKIEGLSGKDWIVQKTTIVTQVTNPCGLRPGISEQVKSLLCYAEVTDMDHDTLTWANDEIEKAGRLGHLRCSSDCYEIIRG
jgi:SAM-dependent methyltransferase